MRGDLAPVLAITLSLAWCDGKAGTSPDAAGDRADREPPAGPEAGTAEGPDRDEDAVLPPESLWSPRELGKGKSKRCFPRTMKEYKLVLGRAGDLVVRVEDFTAVFHSFTLDATRTGGDSVEARRQIVGGLIDQELLALAARKKGYKSDQVGSLLKKRELADMIRRDLYDQAAGEIGEATFKKHYKAHPEKYRVHPVQRRIAQIVVKGKKAAQKLIARYIGEKVTTTVFCKEARSISLEPSAKDTSGRTDWFDREGMNEKARIVPEKHAAAAFKIPAWGNVHPHPLPSSSGWHVIQLLAIREEQWIPFPEVRDSIAQKFIGERQEELLGSLLDSLKKSHPVSVNGQLLERISRVPCL